MNAKDIQVIENQIKELQKILEVEKNKVIDIEHFYYNLVIKKELDDILRVDDDIRNLAPYEIFRSLEDYENKINYCISWDDKATEEIQQLITKDFNEYIKSEYFITYLIEELKNR